MGGSIPQITVVVPCREDENADITFLSLAQQTFHDFKVIVVKDQCRGANWARNKGFEQVASEFVLFSDNDIKWETHALETLMRVLGHSGASWSYGRYKIGQDIWGHQPWNAEMLKLENYISTMSLWRTKDFPGFDEKLKRLQDWDIYLTAMEQGKRGVYCNDLIFTTEIRPGITYGPDMDPFQGYKEAEDIVKKKHGLPCTPY